MRKIRDKTGALSGVLRESVFGISQWGRKGWNWTLGHFTSLEMCGSKHRTRNKGGHAITELFKHSFVSVHRTIGCMVEYVFGRHRGITVEFRIEMISVTSERDGDIQEWLGLSKYVTGAIMGMQWNLHVLPCGNVWVWPWSYEPIIGYSCKFYFHIFT